MQSNALCGRSRHRRTPDRFQLTVIQWSCKLFSAKAVGAARTYVWYTRRREHRQSRFHNSLLLLFIWPGTSKAAHAGGAPSAESCFNHRKYRPLQRRCCDYFAPTTALVGGVGGVFLWAMSFHTCLKATPATTPAVILAAKLTGLYSSLLTTSSFERPTNQPILRGQRRQRPRQCDYFC